MKKYFTLECPEDIKALAYQRIEEAKVLLNSGYSDGAFYLAGYAVELMLKWKICKLFGIDNLFSTDQKSSSAIGNGVSELIRTFKTHDLLALLLYIGLKTKFDAEKSGNLNLLKVHSLVMTEWKESIRYMPCGHTETSDVESVLILLSDHQNGFLKWIEES